MTDDGKGENEQAFRYMYQLADFLQTSDNAVRIFLSLLLGYPLACIYRKYILAQSPMIQHLFFTFFGLGLCYFNFGTDVIHSIINVALIYVTLLTVGGSMLSVILAFVINMGYLCIGYYYTMNESYTIKWTTPHCVLCLRLIGLVFDVYDGATNKEKLSADQLESCLLKIPSLLEICGHTYCFGGFLVGPQFSMKKYLDFVNRKHLKGPNDKPNSIKPSVHRLMIGMLYAVIYQLTNPYLPDSALTSKELLDSSSFLYKCFFITLWSKFMLYKYIGVWLISEGACILMGLSYNGTEIIQKSETKSGGVGNGLGIRDVREKWDGCKNVKIVDYERASMCQDLVSSFNINTNKWMAKYVFKRLKFIGNKDLSQVATLAFLALWHGLYSGYFMNFFLEFFLIKFEREFTQVPAINNLVTYIRGMPLGHFVIWVIKKVHLQFILGYSLVSFCLFTYSRYLKVYCSVFCIVHVVHMILWPAFFYWYKSMNRPIKKLESDAPKKVEVGGTGDGKIS
ncbi:hypothetical protein HELRODRAFT_167215 [Helobdella robusta]|uniref:Lysophospholipid acyltransferase 5 n=1 Tax=Helobdella robusta TaxID=6412 RepID=T1EZ55_HELRO|nr:hypothetical protein HELRODRAFT_167215 [Helobdella robusta]ESO10721.1 hypothetical protein HELRODRAFT_167215 [Helobdella robusta]